MDSDPAQTSQAIDLGAAPVTVQSLNGYGAAGHEESDALVLIGAAFVGGLVLGVLVSRLV